VEQPKQMMGTVREITTRVMKDFIVGLLHHVFE